MLGFSDILDKASELELDNAQLKAKVAELEAKLAELEDEVSSTRESYLEYHNLYFEEKGFREELEANLAGLESENERLAAENGRLMVLSSQEIEENKRLKAALADVSADALRLLTELNEANKKIQDTRDILMQADQTEALGFQIENLFESLGFQGNGLSRLR